MTAREGNKTDIPEGAIVKCFVISHKQNKPQLLNFPALKRDTREQCSPVGQ